MNSENSTFHFQKFSIRQENAAMKVGTDGVLLGAWADASGATTVLDVGAGTGILSLMMAQRYPKLAITSLEPEPGAYQDLQLNVAESDYSERISPINSRVQEFSARNFDCIISNPPYFDSGIAARGARGQARHTSELPLEELFRCSVKLLSRRGKLALILPFGTLAIRLALKSGLFINRQCVVFPDLEEPPIRRLMEFSFRPSTVVHESIYVRESGSYSQVYLRLTNKFYQNLK